MGNIAISSSAPTVRAILPPHPATGDAARARCRALCRLAADLAAADTDQPADAVLGRAGGRSIAAVRALAMYLAHVALGLSLRRVAMGFARHPSTVAHACQRVEERREQAVWDQRIAHLEDIITREAVRKEDLRHG
ncbi:hypothetical protein FHS55_000360 [Angulomicrobium tetraedrale]|uniref:Chromosomal replication initiator DnaA C-terminal domain-containing protein n=1 Tax=Ancylobacter tetraedralis TaxID=217068 RepID=A0A839YZ27_9HYPH|nr:helix-turn-helix domain-containing protein [Ancylobacter tetraedralis]MBB3769774.1 hypothetical protein [Ancylobacter tetraedralis]